MSLSIIVAMTKNRVIGKQGRIPWHIKEDMELFRRLTLGSTVIMGRNTWESLPERFRPLPQRVNIIVSTTLSVQEGAVVCKSVEKALEVAKSHGLDVYCIGGAQLYRSMLLLADTMHISLIKEDFDGDTYFPEIDFSKWQEAYSEDFPQFIYKKYKRVI